MRPLLNIDLSRFLALVLRLCCALSEGVQAKAYLALKRNPGASLLDVLDAIEPQLTLAEMAEAERWIRAWKATAKR